MTFEMNQSELTIQRPDIWLRALDLASSLTRMIYLPKMPGPKGEILACGSYTPYEKRRMEEGRIEELKRRRGELQKRLEDIENLNPLHKPQIEKWISNIDAELERSKKSPSHKAAVVVPEGEMEWLLHEVGHWVAATPAERLLPNYGYGQSVLLNGLGAAREWQAWGFEEIILAPFGIPRMLASPSQRDGVAFNKAGPMPIEHTRYAERQIAGLGIQIEQWREIWGDWAIWRSGHNRYLQ